MYFGLILTTLCFHFGRGALPPLSPPPPERLYVAYELTPLCKEFLQMNATKDGTATAVTAEINIPSATQLRRRMLQLLNDESPYRVILDEKASESFSLYDVTHVTRVAERRSLRGKHEPSSNNTRHHGRSSSMTFQWLKYIELDQVTFPPSSPDRFALAVTLRSLPCVAFAMSAEDKAIQESIDISDETLALPFQRSHGAAVDKVNAIPNDPHYGPRQWYLRMINSQKAWQLWRGPLQPRSEGIIGVADTGCDVTHPDIASRFWKNPGEICGNGIDDDNNGYIDDCYGWNFSDHNSDIRDTFGHGTSVAGSIAPATNNTFGIAGICWSCEIMCLRIGHDLLNVGALAEAVNYAIAYGVKIINFSAAGAPSWIEERAIRAAMTHDVLLVVAAGNSGCDLDGSSDCMNYNYPAKYTYPNILAVGAVTETKQKAQFSNYGETSVDVFAPGHALYLPLSQAVSQQEGLFGLKSGTSFSSPLVAGIAGLIRSRYPTLPYHRVAQAIRASCRKVPDLETLQPTLERVSSKQAALCPGVVDAHRALLYAGRHRLSFPPIAHRSLCCAVRPHSYKTSQVALRRVSFPPPE